MSRMPAYALYFLLGFVGMTAFLMSSAHAADEGSPKISLGRATPWVSRLAPGTQSMSTFSDRSLSLESMSLKYRDVQGDVYTALCHPSQMSSAELQGRHQRMQSGDFYPLVHPESCDELDFNHLAYAATDLSQNRITVRLAQVKRYLLGRFMTRDLYRDPQYLRSTTLVLQCYHRVTSGEHLWNTDYFRCELPEGQGTLMFRVNAPGM